MMMTKELRILLIEDSEDDELLLKRELKKHGFLPHILRVEKEKDFQEALLNKKFDLIISDYYLPHFDLFQGLKWLKEKQMDLPFLVVSGAVGEEAAIACMRAGAHDFIVKDNLQRLVPAIERELEEWENRQQSEETRYALEEVKKQSEAIIQNVVEAIITTDEKGNMELFNKAAEKLFGYSQREVMGKPFEMLIASCPLPAADVVSLPQLYQMGSGGKGVEREIWGKKKDGTEFPLNVSISKIQLQDRCLFTAILCDITEQREMERQIRQSEEKFRRLYNEAPIMYFTQNEHCEIVDVNQTALEKLGYSRNEVVGKKLSHFFLEKSLGSFQEHVKRLKQISFTSGEGKMVTKDGRELDVIFNLRLESSERRIVKTTCVDISETKQLQQQLVHADRLASIGQLAAGISHEINQPLSCISMSAEILLSAFRKGNFSASLFEEELRDILRQTERITKIIQNIKTFSRNLPQQNYQKIDFNQVIRTAKSLIERQFEQKGISLIMDLEEGLPPLLGDTYRLEQVLVNLLLNARDALLEKEKKSESSFEKKICLTTGIDKDSIFLKIWDNGVGIPPSEISKIYDPFYTTKEVGLGTGLGLSIAYGIVGEMKGMIQCKSEPGEWTEFTLNFPAYKEEASSVVKKKG